MPSRRRCLSASRPAKTPCALSTQARRCLPIANRSLHERQSDSLRQQKHQDGNNVLQLAILSRIKLFVRPANPAMPPEEALSQLRFERVGNHLKVSNASPYYVTLVNLKLGGQTLDNLMVAPKSSAQQVLPAATSGTLSGRV